MKCGVRAVHEFGTAACEPPKRSEEACFFTFDSCTQFRAPACEPPKRSEEAWSAALERYTALGRQRASRLSGRRKHELWRSTVTRIWVTGMRTGFTQRTAIAVEVFLQLPGLSELNSSGVGLKLSSGEGKLAAARQLQSSAKQYKIGGDGSDGSSIGGAQFNNQARQLALDEQMKIQRVRNCLVKSVLVTLVTKQWCIPKHPKISLI